MKKVTIPAALLIAGFSTAAMAKGPEFAVGLIGGVSYLGAKGQITEFRAADRDIGRGFKPDGSGGSFGVIARATQELKSGIFIGAQANWTHESFSENYRAERTTNPGDAGESPRNVEYKLNANWSADIMGRAGKNIGNISPYIAAGLSLYDAEITVPRAAIPAGNGDSTAQKISNTHAGWKIAVGADFDVTDKIRIMAQLGYARYGAKKYNVPVDGQIAIQADSKINNADAKIGVLYKF